MDKDVSSIEIQNIVEQFKQNISKNFYNCTNEILKGLGEMYVSDERFTKNIDKYKEGLAIFLRDSFNYYYEIHRIK